MFCFHALKIFGFCFHIDVTIIVLYAVRVQHSIRLCLSFDLFLFLLQSVCMLVCVCELESFVWCICSNYFSFFLKLLCKVRLYSIIWILNFVNMKIKRRNQTVLTFARWPFRIESNNTRIWICSSKCKANNCSVPISFCFVSKDFIVLIVAMHFVILTSAVCMC